QWSRPIAENWSARVPRVDQLDISAVEVPNVSGGNGEAMSRRGRCDIAIGGGKWATGDAGGDGHLRIASGCVLVERQHPAGEQGEQSIERLREPVLPRTGR